LQLQLNCIGDDSRQ